MIKKDAGCRFIAGGLFTKHYFFEAGEVRLRRAFKSHEYRSIQEAQAAKPVLLMSQPETAKRWWLFRDEFYWDNERLDDRSVIALLLERARKDDRRVQRAIALMEQQEVITNATKREVVPPEIRAFVWNRDGGRCAQCGCNQNLEYDHIIPVALGGANTERNLQILCAGCNRSKGTSIA